MGLASASNVVQRLSLFARCPIAICSRVKALALRANGRRALACAAAHEHRRDKFSPRTCTECETMTHRWIIRRVSSVSRPPLPLQEFPVFPGKKKFRKMRVLSIRFLSLLSFQPMQVDLSSNWLTLWSLLGLEIKGRNSIKIRYFSIERDFFLNIATLISFQFRNVDKSIKIWRFLIETDFFVCLKIGFPKIYLGKCEFPIAKSWLRFLGLRSKGFPIELDHCCFSHMCLLLIRIPRLEYCIIEVKSGTMQEISSNKRKN